VDSESTIGRCTQASNSQLIPQSSMKHLELARLAYLSGVSCLSDKTSASGHSPSLTFPSQAAEARNCPQGLMARLLTLSVWAVSLTLSSQRRLRRYTRIVLSVGSFRQVGGGPDKRSTNGKKWPLFLLSVI
jgi:hypothetical protein